MSKAVKYQNVSLYFDHNLANEFENTSITKAIYLSVCSSCLLQSALCTMDGSYERPAAGCN